MKVGIAGGGPAGLYAAIRLKQARPDADIRLYEQNAPNATWGFGVVFSDRALEFLRADDPDTVDLIEPRMEAWSTIRINHDGESVDVDGIGFRSIGRLDMLQLLQARVAQMGVEPVYHSRLSDLEPFEDCDLVIAADGLNSIVRRQCPEDFGESIEYLDNRFVWFGATCAYDALTQTFKRTPYGDFNAHHYRYAPDRSTFLVECSPDAYIRAGFDGMDETAYRALCEEIFADQLKGAELISNHSVWRRFPLLVNKRWFSGNRVLVGDALHTAHYSIGSGTRLALEDVVALVRALEEADFAIDSALPAYQAAREPVLNKLIGAAHRSAQWYEHFGEKMNLSAWPFALSYAMRSGRVGADTLAGMAPDFFAGLTARGISVGVHGD